MPPLERPVDKTSIPLPARKGILGAETDVLVVGGGPAGIGAAIGAASSGAGVVLAERYGFLGGNATAALVMPLMSFHTQRPQPEVRGKGRLLPADHGPGDAVVEGALKLLLERLVSNGGAIPPSIDTGFVVPFDPEVFKYTAIEVLDEAGVDVLLHAFASDLYGEGRIEGVVFETKSGPIVVKAKEVIDCTGDGDLAARAGADFEIGREADQLVQPMTLMFRVVDFKAGAFDAYTHAHPDQWRGVHGLWDLVKKATEAGDLRLEREDILLFATPHEHELSVNSTRITRVLGTDVWDLSYAEWEGRRQMKMIMAFLQRYVPGFEQAYVAQSGVNVGVRETRRIVGDYRLTVDDCLEARKFEDVIARGSYPLDIHNPTGKGTLLKRLPPGEAYDIPLRCLLPRGTDHLLVAGRCISGSHEAHSSYRVMPISMATGHAAGVAAALAALYGTSPRDLDPADVQEELRRQGANLGDRPRSRRKAQRARA